MTLTDAARRIDAAERFMWLNARLVDRLRFDCLFRDGNADQMVTALRGYQNPDGGFGHGLEGDFRGPASQPTTADFALRMLDDVGRCDPDIVLPCYDWLMTVTGDDGGVSMLLPDDVDPKTIWWEKPVSEGGWQRPVTPAVNPTATLVAFLWRHDIDHPWRGPATEFTWRAFDDIPNRLRGGEWPVRIAYDVRFAMQFLDVAPDRERAEKTCAEIGRILLDNDVITFDPAAPGDISLPLDFAPNADSVAGPWFSDDVIETNLDAFAAAQQEDGGWQVAWDIWAPAGGPEWRGWFTIERMKILRSYGRI